jgi:hypothetical protein
LAHTVLGCLSIPDVFYLRHDLVKGYSLVIFGHLRQAKQVLEQAKQRLEAAPLQPVAEPASLATCGLSPPDVSRRRDDTRRMVFQAAVS